MSRTAIFFLLVIAPGLAVLLAVLGIISVSTNPLGWFLLFVGFAYLAGMVIVYWFRRERFWESRAGGTTSKEEIGDCSYWLIIPGMLATFYLPPLEFLYFAAVLPRTDWTKATGVILTLLGALLFGWARRTLGASYSGHVSVMEGQPLVQSGPYRIIRHPAYAGYLLIALGLGIGYSSLAGLAATLLVLLPGVVYRIHVEERFLKTHFDDQFQRYAAKTARLLPGVW